MPTMPVRNKRAKLVAPLAMASNDGVLPTDLLREVLVRIPARELCRLRLVCQSWRSLTSEPDFMKAHTSRHPHIVGFHVDSHQIHFMDLSGNVVKRIPMPDQVPGYNLMSQLDLVCISSCWDGLAFVHSSASGINSVLPEDTPFDCNSAVRIIASTFIPGYVPSTGEYKMLCIQECLHEKTKDYYQRCDVLTLLKQDCNNRWRDKRHPPFQVHLLPGDIAVIGMVAYFLVMDSTKPDDIASFNFATEEWSPSILQGPISSHLLGINYESSNVALAGFSDCLTVLVNNNDYFVIDLWFLADMGTGLWNKLYSIQYRSDLEKRDYSTSRPRMILDNGDIVVWVQHTGVLKAYNPRTKVWTYLGTTEGYFPIETYMGSLQS